MLKWHLERAAAGSDRGWCQRLGEVHTRNYITSAVSSAAAAGTITQHYAGDAKPPTAAECAVAQWSHRVPMTTGCLLVTMHTLLLPHNRSLDHWAVPSHCRPRSQSRVLHFPATRFNTFQLVSRSLEQRKDALRCERDKHRKVLSPNRPNHCPPTHLRACKTRKRVRLPQG